VPSSGFNQDLLPEHVVTVSGLARLLGIGEARRNPGLEAALRVLVGCSKLLVG
jgi:hypothetical protein